MSDPVGQVVTLQTGDFKEQPAVIQCVTPKMYHVRVNFLSVLSRTQSAPFVSIQYIERRVARVMEGLE